MRKEKKEKEVERELHLIFFSLIQFDDIVGIQSNERSFPVSET